MDVSWFPRTESHEGWTAVRNLLIKPLIALGMAGLVIGAGPAGSSDDGATARTKNVPTPKDPLFPGFFVNYYTDDAPKVGMLHGVYKTYAVASEKAARLRRSEHVVKAEIEWIDDDGKTRLDVVGRSGEQLTGIAKSLAGANRRVDYARTPRGQTQCSKFARDFAKEFLGGREVPELAGTANSQYDRLKSSPNVEKLWIPDGHEADLAAARQSLAAAHQFEKDRQAAIKEGDADKAKELEQERDNERYTARLKADGLQDAFQAAQLRANNQGDLVLVAWKSGPSAQGHIAVVVPSPEEGPRLAPSGDWGLMKMPHIAQAGDEVFADETMNYGFRSVDTIQEIAIFVLKNP